MNKWLQYVVVTSDEALDNLQYHIFDATRVIHFDIPAVSATYGKRVWCMAASFNPSSDMQLRRCESIWLLTTASDNLIPRSVAFLKRTNAVIPNELVELEREISRKVAPVHLCQQLKMFGKCL